ncbi:MAG: ABC transporter permease [Flavobacteriales bacterium CG18_big_fil_WC_8_21_14_2_50_32_9]|nr:MAG: ABC transporter permease [Flavobacteriales bacterium CG18_big_fil_WC_8_21_14_2_50_32_9]
MNKIALIIQREYLTRVKKTSFILMTLFGPILMAGLMLIPIWLGLKDKDIQIIEVIDDTRQFINQFEGTNTIQFYYEFKSIDDAKKSFYKDKYTSILHISNTDKNTTAYLYYKKQPGLSTVSKIESTIEKGIKNIELEKQFNISRKQLDEIQPKVTVKSVSIDEAGLEESKNVGVSTFLGFGGAILIYTFIFMYGIQIMRGVIEEKTSRIVEIIISSVKPFQLMMGKIVGIALVGLTQFSLWIILSMGIYSVGMGVLASSNMNQLNFSKEAITNGMSSESENEISENKIEEQINEMFSQIPITKIVIAFLFYFLGGYLLYGAFLAAIGSAVDSEADTQQFMMPITIPLIFSFIMASSVMENPDGPLAFWLSIIPLTSPIIMMVRIPFGVATWELLLSMALLVLGFLGATWMAAKIYRTGILMYGKKITYKELLKWLFYKE